jgi:hypothetical protein
MEIFRHEVRARLIQCLVLTLGAFSWTAWADGQASCVTLLPKALTGVLRDNYPGWRVLELSDLAEDDRKIWEQARGKVCPGVARGNFDGSGESQHAVLLLNRKARSAVLVVHAAKGKNGSYRLSKMLEGESSRPPVIHRQPPGKYYRAEDTRSPIDIKTDVIYLESIEAGATVLYFSKGMPTQVVVSN